MTSVGPVSCVLIREHAEALTAQQAVTESRKSRGFLTGLMRRSQDLYKPTYNHVQDGSACRIYGSLSVKRISGAPPCDRNATLTNASLFQQTCTSPHSAMAIAVEFMLTTTVCPPLLLIKHIFTSFTVMNLSHVITEFSFGKYFPEITQPLDNSFEVAHDGASFSSREPPR